MNYIHNEKEPATGSPSLDPATDRNENLLNSILHQPEDPVNPAGQSNLNRIPTYYKCVTDIDGIVEYISDHEIVAFDYETAPDDEYRDVDKAALDPHKSHVVGCNYSVAEGTGIYVPIDHKIGNNLNKDAFWEYQQDFLSNHRITKVAHNIAFESMMSYAAGIVIQAPVYDTICAAQMTLKNDYEFRTLSESGLKRLAVEICDEPLPTFTDVTNGRHFDELDPQDPETIRYGAADSDYALRLFNIFNDWFNRFMPMHRTIIEQIESPTAVYIGIMKYNGIPVDETLMEEKKIEAEAEMKRISSKIAFIIGDIDIGANCSTKVFKDYLYTVLQLPVLKTTVSGKESVDDQAIQMLKEYCDNNRPELSELFALVQEYRKLGKIKTTYIDGYAKYINSETHRIHPDMFALSTDTGRFSCSNPNLQNMPRLANDPIGIRDFVKAPDGKVIISLDFSQIELRVGAFYCRDEHMLETYRNNGDIHAQTTSVIFGVTYEQAKDKNATEYKEHRSIAKNCNFGVFYGLYPRGLQNTLKFKAGIDKTVEECAEIINSLKAGYKNLAVWQAYTKDNAYRNMYTETWMGRRRYLPDIRSDDWSKRSFAERCSMNTPIQGTAADIIKMAIARILGGLPERPWLEPILQIHDELTFIIPEDRLAESVAFVKECMEVQPFPEFDLPLIAEGAVGQTFGSLKELDMVNANTMNKEDMAYVTTD